MSRLCARKVPRMQNFKGLVDVAVYTPTPHFLAVATNSVSASLASNPEVRRLHFLPLRY
jgi:hypothetical protein